MFEEKMAIDGAVAAAAPAAGTAAAKAAPAAVPVAKSASVLSGTKAFLISPLFGFLALGGVIAFELWKGNKDSREIEAAKRA